MLSLKHVSTLVMVCLGASWCLMPTALCEDALFSGPQVGEKLPAFEVRGVLDNDAGKTINFVSEASGKPTVLIFIHEATRPSLGFTRTLAEYTHTRAKDGLVTGIVWLDSDATAAENMVKRVRHALPRGARVGVSLEGQEGPGSYGLNRNVMLTIVIAKDNKVTANFALVQPSLQSDLPKVLQKVVDVVGGTVPKLSDVIGANAYARMNEADTDEQHKTLLRSLIRKDAKPEEVDKAAAELEASIAKNEAARKEVGRIANTIVDSGKLSNYGTPRAQEILRKWAETYRSPATPAARAQTQSPATEPSQPKNEKTSTDKNDVDSQPKPQENPK